MARDSDPVNQREHGPRRRVDFKAARNPTREPGQKRGEDWKSYEGVRDSTMVFNDCERIARQNFADNVHVRENSSERGRKNGNAPFALRKISFTEKCACDSVSYGIHEAVEKTKVYMIGERSGDFDQRRTFRNNLADSARRNCAALERRHGCVRKFWRYGREKASGRLRVVEQRAKFLGNTFGEADATFKKFAIVLHAAGKKLVACGFDRAREIGDALMIDLR